MTTNEPNEAETRPRLSAGSIRHAQRAAAPIEDWERCIICKVQAHGGRIAHKRTCPDG